MGGYFSSKKEKKEEVEATDGAAGGTPEEKRRGRYKLTYLERDVQLNEHPADMRALFVLKRTG